VEFIQAFGSETFHELEDENDSRPTSKTISSWLEQVAGAELPHNIRPNYTLSACGRVRSFDRGKLLILLLGAGLHVPAPTSCGGMMQ
jgi:hypothetical protein